MFAALCVVVSGMGHAMMSGADVPMWTLGYAFAGTTAGAWWLTGRERGAATVVGATVMTQAALHVLFMLGQLMAALPPSSVAASGTDATGGTGAMGVMAGMPGMGGPAGHPMHMREWSPGMVAAHIAAAALCGWWLWRGEVAVYRIGRALASFLTAPLRLARGVRPIPLPSPPGVPRPRGRHAGPPAETSLRHFVVRRGPPDPTRHHRLAPVMASRAPRLA